MPAVYIHKPMTERPFWARTNPTRISTKATFALEKLAQKQHFAILTN